MKTRFCPYCGEPRVGQSRFCIKCGKELPLTEEEKTLINKFGTDKTPEVFENVLGVLKNPIKTMQRVYHLEDDWHPAFIIPVLYGVLMSVSFFIVLLKINLSIIGSDSEIVNFYLGNMLYIKIYWAIFEGVLSILSFIFYVGILYLIIILVKKRVRFSKLIILGEYASIYLLFFSLTQLIIAILIPQINCVINLDTYYFDFNTKLNNILYSNLLFLILNNSDYLFILIFYILVGFGLSPREDLNRNHLIIILAVSFLVVKVGFPLILYVFGIY
ncbi:MAG: zinc ribbon domain-containing protein [Candidatus Helarchaeota archaeon]